MAGQNPNNLTVALFVKSVIVGHPESLELFGEICDYLGNAFAPPLIQVVACGQLQRNATMTVY